MLQGIEDWAVKLLVIYTKLAKSNLAQVSCYIYMYDIYMYYQKMCVLLFQFSVSFSIAPPYAFNNHIISLIW